jgi:hypothetical protein
MAFIRGQAVTGFPFGLVNKDTGESITTGDVDIYITIDGGAQFAALGEPVHEGNGQWTVNFNGNEIDGRFIGILIIHPDSVPQHFTIEAIESDPTVPVISVTVTSSGTSISDTFEYYGTLLAAEHYFNYKLDSSDWDLATIKDREKALIQATRAIDKLNFLHDKFNIDQTLQFPRGVSEAVPIEIEYACYEIAIKLLGGIDVDVEAKTLGVMSESYTGIRTAYDPSFVNEHIRAGIPSIEAWEYLKPFLRDSRTVKLLRV